MLKRNSLFLLLFLGIGLLPSLLRPVSRQQELRVLVVARNMVESGDWLHPVFQNQPRYRKPPLAYWTSATAMQLSGTRSSAIPPRLFNLLAAAGVAWLLRDLAGRKGLSRDGTLVLFIGSFGFWRFAPLAETDFWLLLGVVGAIWSWDRSRGALAGCFMALGVLAKGPAALAIPLLVFLGLHLRNRRTVGNWMAALLPPITAGAAWIAFLKTDPIASAALQQELRDTFVRSPHAAPPWYYLYTLPKMFLPGVLFLFALRKARIPALPTIWFCVAFLLLSLTPSKQDHYSLLLLPPATLCLLALLRNAEQMPWMKIGMAVTVLWMGVELAGREVNPYARDQRFLQALRPAVADRDTLHVVGINSAIFDWNLGRHVENRESVSSAWRQSSKGDAVIVIRKHADQADETLLAPQQDGSDALWARQLWFND